MMGLWPGFCSAFRRKMAAAKWFGCRTRQLRPFRRHGLNVISLNEPALKGGPL